MATATRPSDAADAKAPPAARSGAPTSAARPCPPTAGSGCDADMPRDMERERAQGAGVCEDEPDDQGQHACRREIKALASRREDDAHAAPQPQGRPAPRLDAPFSHVQRQLRRRPPPTPFVPRTSPTPLAARCTPSRNEICLRSTTALTSTANRPSTCTASASAVADWPRAARAMGASAGALGRHGEELRGHAPGGRPRDHHGAVQRGPPPPRPPRARRAAHARRRVPRAARFCSAR